MARKTKRPMDTPFRQSRMPATRPLLLPKHTALAFAIATLVLLPIGIGVLVAQNTTIEATSPDYDEACATNYGLPNRVDTNPCTVTLTLTQAMPKPVYLYYELENYYANHRKFVRSRSDAQLGGESNLLATSSDLTVCEYYYAADENTSDPSYADASNVISPCGLVARAFFNDSFALLKPDGTAASARETGIAWASDAARKYKNAADGTTGLNYAPFADERSTTCAALAGARKTECEARRDEALSAGGFDPGLCYRGSGECVENEHFMVWMRTAALPTFRKLYAIIDEDLAPGSYSVRVSSGSAGGALYPVHGFGGKKRVVLSTLTGLGGRNRFLGAAFVGVGCVCFGLASVLLLLVRLRPRSPGSAPFLTSPEI